MLVIHKPFCTTLSYICCIALEILCKNFFFLTGSKSQESSRRQSTTSAQKEKLYSDCDTPSSGYELRCSSALSVDINCLQENVNVVDIYTIAQPLRYFPIYFIRGVVIVQHFTWPTNSTQFNSIQNHLFDIQMLSFYYLTPHIPVGWNT